MKPRIFCCSFVFFLLIASTFVGGAAEIVLPIRVMGVRSKTVQVDVPIPPGRAPRALHARIHNLGYDGKASVTIGGGDPVLLTNEASFLGAFRIGEPGRAYGGIGGGYSTLDIEIPFPAGQVPAGQTSTITFRFTGTDGVSMGYRVLDFDLVDNRGRSLLPAELFVEEDPETWSAPIAWHNAIVEGESLWRGAALVDSPLEENPIRATCASCHTQDGRDLEYFAYSNEAIVKRSMFHGLTNLQGRQIASYIRSLNVPRLGRPWNPPYQPAPGLDSLPVEAWAAGGGLEAVLEKDIDMLPHLFPNGMSRPAIREVFYRNNTLNAREMPVALQFPDWNTWLPSVDPVDIWGDYFINGEAYQGYLQAREELSDPNLRTRLIDDAFERVTRESRTFLKRGVWTGAGTEWRLTSSRTLNRVRDPHTVERAKEALVKWGAVKNWELAQEFRLEDRSPEILEYGEVRAWPRKRQAVHPVAPHIVADNLTHFAGQAPVVGKYFSTAWYHLELVLNGGQRQRSTNIPQDWPYHFRHIRELADVAGGGEFEHPLRFIQGFIKCHQMRSNGAGPADNGWILRALHPWWLYSDTRGKRDLFLGLKRDVPGLWKKVVEAYLTEMLATFGEAEFDLDDWPRAITSRQAWYGLEPESYVPQPYGGTGQVFEFPSINNADSFFRLLPRLAEAGVDRALLLEVADWCSRAWPSGDWEASLDSDGFAGFVASEFTPEEIFLGAGAPGWDADGDGAPNLLDLALGGKMTVYGSKITSRLTGNLRNDGRLELRFRYQPELSFLRYIVEESCDLSTWEPVAWRVAGTEFGSNGRASVTTSVSPNGQVHNAVVRVRPTEDGQACFLRLRVEEGED